MAGTSSREAGREAFSRRAWADAWTSLTEADREKGLTPEDLELLAIATYLIGRDADSAQGWERAYHGWLHLDDAERAVRCAAWLVLGLLLAGESARAAGWLTRARRLLDDADHVRPESGYLDVMAGLQCLMRAEVEPARAAYEQAVRLGEDTREPDLLTLSRLGMGLCLIENEQRADGIRLLDEAMVAVTADEVSPMTAGLVYCAVIEACQETFDLPRAREWTLALSNWCTNQPDLVPYRGNCLVHRVEIMQLDGDWAEAMDEVRNACVVLADPPQPAMGVARYQQGEIHRLRGEHAAAEEAYREASRWGHDPQPGLGRLRLAQGKVDAAVSGLRRALAEEGRERVQRPKLLAALVEAELEAGDVPRARSTAQELHRIAGRQDVPLLHALAAQALAATCLAEGDAGAALDAARRAWSEWHRSKVPYEAARARVLVARACRALGDHDAAEMEHEAARAAFERLSARGELARLDRLAGASEPVAVGGLTPREREVLRLVASGRTNREIAAELFLSQKTVARHVSNILAKLELPTRSAATAYAYEHHLV